MDSVYEPEAKTVYGYYDCWWYGNDCIPEKKRKWSRLNKTGWGVMTWRQKQVYYINDSFPILILWF